MAIKTIAQLRARFEGDDKPTQQDYIDLIDTIEAIQAAALSALSSSDPVDVVADEAARLAAGPTTDVGSRIKQTDTGITYVKQQEPGSSNGDWVAIGDAAIVIADVSGLQAYLNQLLRKDENDETTGVLGTEVFRLSTYSVNTLAANEVTVRLPRYAFEYAFRAVDSVIKVTNSDTPVDGASCTIAIKNTSGGNINITLDAGIIPMQAAFPAVLGAGKWLIATIHAMTVPLSGTSPGQKYFISWGMEN